MSTATAVKKQALPFKRRSQYLAYPEDLYLEKKPGKKHYDPRVHEPFTERDVRWMMVHGVLQGVSVEKAGGDRVVVVDGRQRVINSLEANRRLVEQGLPRIRIPVVPKRGDEITLFRIGVICNEHRKPENPVSQAYKMSKYMDLGHDENDCADLWGVTDRTVRNRLYLLDLCDEVQKAVVEGKITVSNAIKLRALSHAAQRKALKAPKPERKARRPSQKKIKLVLDERVKLPKTVRVAIQWVTGEITDEEAAKEIKALGKALAAPADDPNQRGLFDE